MPRKGCQWNYPVFYYGLITVSQRICGRPQPPNKARDPLDLEAAPQNPCFLNFSVIPVCYDTPIFIDDSLIGCQFGKAIGLFWGIWPL